MKKLYTLLAVLTTAMISLAGVDEKKAPVNYTPFNGEPKALVSIENIGGSRACEETLFFHTGESYYVTTDDQATYGYSSRDADGFSLHSDVSSTGRKDSFIVYYEVVEGDTNYFWRAFSWFDPAGQALNLMSFQGISIPETGAAFAWEHRFVHASYRDDYAVMMTDPSTDSTIYLHIHQSTDATTAGDTVWTTKAVYIDQEYFAGKTVDFSVLHYATDGVALDLDNFFLLGCDDLITGMDEAIENEVKIFPNPTNNILNVNVTSLEENIQIYNVLGELVYQNANPSLSNRIDVSELTKGMYIVKVGNVSERVVIK